MKEKAFLVVYLLRIPFKFTLSRTTLTSPGDSIVIESMPVTSHIDYISEYGIVTSQESKETQERVVLIKAGARKIKVENRLVRSLSMTKEASILHLLSSFGTFKMPLFDNMRYDASTDMPANMRYDMETDQIDNSYKDSFNSMHHNQLNNTYKDQLGSGEYSNRESHNDISPAREDSNTLTFQVSKFSFFLLSYFLKPDSSSKIHLVYSELKRTPFLITFFLHLPLAITCFLIIILVLSFDSGITRETVQDEIDKLPIEKYKGNEAYTECPICLESYSSGQSVRTLQCKHSFHQECLDSWLKTMLKCPLCRMSVCKLAETPSYELYQTLNYQT